MLGPRLPSRALLLALALFLLGLAPALALQGTPGPGTATPATGATAEVLVELTLPAESIPTGPVEVGFGRGTYDPGASVAYPAGAFRRGVAFDHVVAGAFAVRVDGPAAVVRAATGDSFGTPEPVAPGTQLTLNPGETVVYLDNASAQTLGSAGTDPTSILIVSVTSTTPPANPPGPAPAGVGVEGLAGLTPEDWAALPSGPVIARLTRVSLPAGTAAPVGATGELGLLVVETGAVGLGARAGTITDVRGGTEGRIAPGAQAVLGPRDYAVLRPGTLGAARTAGDGAAAFWTLTFAPAEPTPATPAAATPAP